MEKLVLCFNNSTWQKAYFMCVLEMCVQTGIRVFHGPEKEKVANSTPLLTATGIRWLELVRPAHLPSHVPFQ